MCPASAYQADWRLFRFCFPTSVQNSSSVLEKKASTILEDFEDFALILEDFQEHLLQFGNLSGASL
jgi:hypothetical protein